MTKDADRSGMVADGAPRQRFFRRHPKKTLAAMVLLAVPVLDIGVTALLQVTGLYETPWTLESAFRRRHALYHHDLRPSVFVKDGGMWGENFYDVATNSLGFKDAEPRDVPLAPAPGTKRVLLIGDSFTEGVGVTYPNTFAGILDRQLRGRDVEVLNAGVATYSPMIYYRKCQYLLDVVGLKFDHLVVCLDVSDIVDEVRHYWVDDANRVRSRLDGIDDVFKAFVRDHTILMGALRRWLHDWNLDRTPRRNPELEPDLWDSNPDLWERYGKPGLASSGRQLHALHELLRERGIGMTLFVYPWRTHVQRHVHDCVQATHWQKWAEERSIHFISAFPKFLDAGDPNEVIRQNFIVGDIHWNKAGHAMIAEVLLEQLVL